MAYSDFSAQELTAKFNIKFRAASLFTAAQPLEPSAWLLETLRRGRKLGFSSEKSRSERLVTPILLELSERNPHHFVVYSGINLNVDAALGLSGECDFVFSFSRIQDFLTAPIFCITEAKKQDLEQGTVQCAAQLIAARQFNKMEGNDIPVLYGCVTTGIEWRFLQSVDADIVVDDAQYLLTELAELLGVLQNIVDDIMGGMAQ